MQTPNNLLVEAARALRENRLQRAEQLIRSCLAIDVTNPEATRLLAGVAAATGYIADAEKLLRLTIERAPDFVPAYADLCALLGRLDRTTDAILLLDGVSHSRGAPPWALSLKAATWMAIRRPDEAQQVLAQLVEIVPDAAVPWVNYAEALQVTGRLADAITAYRKAITLEPGNGFAWWGLANLRTIRLGVDDIALMEQSLESAQPGITRVQLLFALGRALGDHDRFEESFCRYGEANRQRGCLVPYDPQVIDDYVHAVETVFTSALFQERVGQGRQEDAPIFIVGMPRAGSTLVEQILACHPWVEAFGETFELPNIAMQIVREGASRVVLPEEISRLTAAQLAEIGQTYMASVQRFRRTDRPVVVDKLPANWQLVPLIRLILPKARIIDVRRHPMACCFSAYTTYFNRRTSFPTTLADLGRYYRAYARMTDHFVRIHPGSVYRLDYERLVASPETEVRRLLSWLDFPFIDACLSPQDNDRAVYTPSAQQVRQPINHDGLEQWKNYADWLKSLRESLHTVT